MASLADELSKCEIELNVDSSNDQNVAVTEPRERVPPASPRKSIIRYRLILALSCTAISLPVIIGYVFEIGVKISAYIVSIYALLTVVHLVMQLCLASINRLRFNTSINEDPENKIDKTSLLVVGYREDPEYWKQCLDSLSKVKQVSRVVAVIDGDQKDDECMAIQFMRQFPGGILVKPGFILADTLKDELIEVIERAIPAERSAHVCILQPHGGKRAAMYTGFKLLRNEESVVVTDSDTMLDENAAAELLAALNSSKSVGAATGNVSIFNNETPLTFMSSLRYWFAFNLERAADSIMGAVMCVSGPLGIYRMSAISEKLRQWKSQRFLGNECTYGDDRSLTNIVLNKGYSVLYNHKAKCATESPSSILKWIAQQTRWTKSFYREILFYRPELFTFKSIWIYFSMAYYAIFPILGIYALIFVLFLSYYSLSQLLVPISVWAITIVAMSTVKSLFGLLVSRNIKILLIPIYSFVYITLLLPIKITALFSLDDTSWLTAPRAGKTRNKIPVESMISIILWNIILISGIAYSIWKSVMLDHYSQ